MTSLLNKIWCIFPVLLLIGLCTSSWVPQRALADTGGLPSPGAVEESIEERKSPESTELPEIIIEDEQGKSFMGQDGVTFLLKDITFEGNRIFSSEELESLLSNFMGREIEVNALLSMADILTDYYRQQGYILSKAYVPPQTIKDQVLIKIREGRLGEILIKGNQKYSNKLIKNTLKLIRAEGAVKLADLERGLLLLLDYPGLEVKATLKPGEKAGTSDLVINVVEEKRYQFGIDYNNFGSKYVSEHRIGATAAFNDVLGYGDQMSIRVVRAPEGSDNLLYGRTDYILPLGNSGIRMGLYFAALSYELGEELEVFEIEGETEKGGIWFEYPFIRSRNFSLWGDVGFEFHDVKETFADQKLGEDKLRKGHAGVRFQSVDDLLGGGATNIVLTGYKGLTDLFDGSKNGDIDLVRIQSEPDFFKLMMNYSRHQKLPYNLIGLLSITSQYTNSRLPSSEQMHLGGAGTVRGYSMSEFSGDKGFYGTAELRIPFSQADKFALQMASFLDYGKVLLNDTLVAESPLRESTCVGYGVGIRFSVFRYLKVKVDYAKAVGGDDPLDTKVKYDGIWYLQLSLNN